MTISNPSELSRYIIFGADPLRPVWELCIHINCKLSHLCLKHNSKVTLLWPVICGPMVTPFVPV